MKPIKPGRAYLISTGIGLLIMLAVLSSRDILNLTDRAAILSALCDGFFVPGILYLCLALLVVISGTGQFDMLSYGMHSLLVLFTPFKKAQEHESYYDYKVSREIRRQTRPRPYLFLVGSGFMVMSLICLAMYALV